MTTKDESEAFYQMLEALMSARRYILAQQYYPPELIADIDAAIRRAQIGIRAPSYGPNAKAAFRRSWDGYGAFESACGRSPRSNEELHEWLELRRGR